MFARPTLRALALIFSCALLADEEAEVIVELVPPEPASTREVKPIYKLLAYRPNTNKHISELDDNLFVVKLAEFTDEDQARAFIKSHPSLDVIGLRVKEDEKLSFVILLGVYDDADTARWAEESFVEENPRFEEAGIERLRLGDLKPHIVL